MNNSDPRDLTMGENHATLGGAKGGRMSSIDSATLDSLSELLRRSEDYAFHHAAKNKAHFRTWALAQVLYELIALLCEVQEDKEESDSD